MIVPSFETIEVPKFQLSKEVTCSNDFRESYDDWLLEFFGTETIHHTTEEKVLVTEKVFEEMTNSENELVSTFAKMFGLFGTAGLFL